MKQVAWLVVLIFILLNKFAVSQEHQIYGSTGYNFPTATVVIGKTHNYDIHNFNTDNFAKGAVLQLGYSYKFNNNLLLDLNVNYLFGVTNETYYSSFDAWIGNVRYFGLVRSYSNSNFSVSPSIVMMTSFGKFSPYIKFGGSINLISITELWDYTEEQYTRELFYEGDLTLGWQAGIGMNYLWESVIMFIEFQLNSLTYYPTEVKVIKTTSESTSETTYELDDGFHPIFGFQEPRFVYDFPFSSLGILVGLRYVL